MTSSMVCRRVCEKLVTLSAAGALTGCATVVDIAERHGDANLVQERVMNQQLLLNVVRAAHRQPMHFSRIPYIKLPLVNSSPWEFTFPFGDVGNYVRNSAKTSVGGGLITVEIAPQDSQEFIQGITTPVRLNLMHLYLQQGWPKQLVFYLFVEELRMVQKKDKGSQVLFRLRNDPGDAPGLKRFAAAVDEITNCDLSLDAGTAARGPRLWKNWTAPLSGLPEAIAAGSIVGDSNGGLAIQIAGTPRFKLTPLVDSSNPADCLPDSPTATAANIDQARPDNEHERKLEIKKVIRNWGAVEQSRSGEGKSLDKSGPDGPSQWVELVLRSPDSMVYYLGEVLRSGGNVTLRRDRDPQGPRATLFNAASENVGIGIQPSGAAAWVDYWGKRYSIPQPDSMANPGDRSMQSLALLGQVLQLQNKAAAPPRAASYRVEP